MCGIIIAISKKKGDNVLPLILESLNILQNRGYDSVGISLNNNNKWEIYKNSSTQVSNALSILSNSIKDKMGNMGLGHTRWATHGAKSNINSHPHISMNGNILLVHNGIIINFLEIKNFLIGEKFKFYTETDTEVIANLIEYFLSKNNSISKSIELACDELNGTWALGIVCILQPEKIYVTRHGSPLILGYNDNEFICTSELSGFNGLIYNYIIPENKDIIEMTSSEYKSINTTKYELKTVNQICKNYLPSEFSHWTIKEIYEQPKTILLATNNGARIIDDEIILGGLSGMKRELNKIDHLILVGCGTSYHSCLLGKFYFDNFETVQAFDGSEFNGKLIPKRGNVLVIFCSQSGETYDLLNGIKICKERDCLLMGIINVEESLIAREVDFGVYLNAGTEVAVPSTKSFTSMLIVLSLLGMYFKSKIQNKNILTSLRKLPFEIENLLIDNKFKLDCEKIIKFINSNMIRSIFILGREKLYPISLEIALKIKEMSYIHAEGYSGGSLKHGPFAILDKKALVFLLIDDMNINSQISTYHEIAARETHCYIVTDSKDPTVLNLTNNILILPNIKYYNEIVFVIAFQYLSYHLSISRNINPDKPRNLAKVVTVA